MFRPFTRPPPHKIRRSQLITVFGPGSIVDLRNDSAMPTFPWPDDQSQVDRIYEERLQRRLGVEYFRQPPAYSEEDRKDLAAVKFPAYHYCPACHVVHDDFNVPERKTDGVKCRMCRKNRLYMTPARFIAACRGGHAQDFPFREWVHRGPTTCTDVLRMETLGKSAGLRDILLKCGCGARRPMEGAFSRGALAKVKVACQGHHPWNGSSEECHEEVRALQRGASNFYFAEIVSSISIPPWDDKFSEVLARFRNLSEGKAPDTADPDDVVVLRRVLKREGLQDTDVSKFFEWLQRCNAPSGGEDEYHAFKVEEFQAFKGLMRSMNDRPRFRVNQVPVPSLLKSVVSQVVLATVLEEVRSIVGYRRISPATGSEDDGVSGRLVSFRTPNQRWLPAVRIRGEGIFVRFDAESVDAWGAPFEDRARRLQAELERRHIADKPGMPRVTPRFLFCHSFAHILMRRMSLTCGYASGSIRERIYCGRADRADGRDMAAVLIYTAASDSEGSLGGLVRMGEPDQLGPVVQQAVRDAAWCSSDPICSETANPGERTMNMCACHACLFVPETSCEYFNSLLDRRTLVGDLQGAGGYLSHLV